MIATQTQTQTQTRKPLPVDSETWGALMPHERNAMLRAFGQGPDSGTDLMPHERKGRPVAVSLRD